MIKAITCSKFVPKFSVNGSARLCPSCPNEPNVRNKSKSARDGPSCPNCPIVRKVSERYLGVCPTESRAEAILSEPSRIVRKSECPNEHPCLQLLDNRNRTQKWDEYNFACPPWLCQLLINIIGRKNAEKALIEGQVFSPKDALSIGLVDKVTNDAEKATKDYFERLSAIPLDARMRTKYALREVMTAKIMETAARDGDRFVEHVMKPATQDAVEKALAARR